MDTQHIKKAAVRKYAKILHVDNPISVPRLTTSSGFSVSPTSAEFLDKLSSGTLKTPDNYFPYPKRNNSYQASVKGSPTIRLDSSVYAPSQKILTTNSDNYCFTVPSMDDRNLRLLDSPGPKSLKSVAAVTAREGLDYMRHTQGEFKSSMGYIRTSPNLKSGNKIKSVSSMKGHGLDDLYRDAKDFSQELNEILSQQHEKTLRAYMKQLNVKDFASLQKSRIKNVLRLVDKGFIPKDIKETNNLMSDIWNVACTELNKVRAHYEEFLFGLEETLENVARGKKKINDQMQPWEALKLLIEHSYLSRVENKQEDMEHQAMDPMQAIYNFKLDYKTSKIYNPKILSIYELIEVHMKELNQLIAMERENSKLLVKQKDKLQMEHTELEKKQIELKAEMMNLLHNRHKVDHKKEDSIASVIEERHLRRHIDDLQTENLKLFDEASQLRKELKETKSELKKMITKEEKNMKKTHEIGVMVDLFNNQPQGQIQIPKPKGLTSYILDPQSCVNGTEISKDLIISLTNLMLSDKMITDVCDDFEKRPRKPLNNYLSEWFLKRFGLYDFCDIMLRDYAYTLHNTEGGERYRILKEILGMTNGDFQTVFRFSLDRPSQIDRKKLRKATFSTAETAKQFQKIVACIKTSCGQSSTPIFPAHTYGPYLPAIDMTRNLLSFEAAKTVLVIITKEANFTPEEIKDAEEYLKLRIQEQDLETKIIEEENPEAAELPANSINFDVFVRFLLEALSEKQIRGLERYYATLKTHVVAQKQANISFDEYVACVDKLNPETSQVWRDHSFAQMMSSQAANNVPLFVLMQNLVDSYFNVDKARDSDNAKVQTERELRFIAESERTTGRISQNKPKKPTFTKFGGNLLTPTLNQGARPSSSRQKIFPGYRDGLSLGNNVLNEVGYEMYDCVSSLIVLQETYNLVEEAIKDAEKVNDALGLAHETFKKEMDTFPKQMVDAQKDVQKAELLLAFNKEDLVDGLEHLWMRFRSLLVYTFRQKS